MEIESLKTLSQNLMWAALVSTIASAILTAGFMSWRYFVDRRITELSSQAQIAAAEVKDKIHLEHLEALKTQLEIAKREQKEASIKFSQMEESVEPRHLTSQQSAILKMMAHQTLAVLLGLM